MFHLSLLLLANRISNSVIDCNLFVVYKYDFNQAHRASQLNDTDVDWTYFVENTIFDKIGNSTDHKSQFPGF